MTAELIAQTAATSGVDLAAVMPVSASDTTLAEPSLTAVLPVMSQAIRALSELIMVSLSPPALVWSGVIFLSYLLTLRLNQSLSGRRSQKFGVHRPPPVWSSPIITASLVVGTLAVVSGQPLETVNAGGALWMWLLVPATAAMGIPLYDYRHLLRLHLRAIFPAIVIGSLAAVGSALLIAWLGGVSTASLLALTSKSVTTPIAVSIGLEIGAPIGLAACLVIITGLIGIAIGPSLFRILGWHDHAAQGLAYGLAAHAIGTADAWQKHHRMGSFAALALAVNGFLTGLILPILISWIGAL